MSAEEDKRTSHVAGSAAKVGSAMAKSTPDVAVVYNILKSWAESRNPIRHYSDLSRDYLTATKVSLPPHGSWDRVLGDLNRRLYAATPSLPALSALVTLKGATYQEPGGDFWGCAPNVPPRPKTDEDRVAVWGDIVKHVLAAKWPPSLP